MLVFVFSAAALMIGELRSSANLPSPPPANATSQFAQVTITRRSVIRVTPALSAPIRRLPPANLWKEKDAPDCIPTSALAGLMISKPDSIDLLLHSGQLVRAKLEKGCPSIDFYSGFYMKPTKDGRICEDRDTIHSRTGGACEIDKFKTLTPPK
ncbi:MAG: hypothetical protein ABL918_04470 [Chakrabartia sp.]